MIEKLIEECEKALEYNLYFAALNIALTLPDICGKAAFPNEKSNKIRYINWYDEYIGNTLKLPSSQDQTYNFPYASGKIVYNLRCSILHQGNPNISLDKCKITDFSLIYETQKEPIHIYSWGSGTLAVNKSELSLNIRTLCWAICETVKWYYDQCPEQFNFFHYRLIDWDQKIEKECQLCEQNKRFEKKLKGEKDDQT